MRKFLLSLATIAILSASPAAASPNKASELGRIAKWSLVYDEVSCNLSSVFGPGKSGDGDGDKIRDRDMVLAIFSYDIDRDSFTLELVGKAFRAPEPRVPVSIAFAHGEDTGRYPARQVTGQMGMRGGMTELMIPAARLDNAPPETVGGMVPDERLAAIDSLTIRTRGVHLRLKLGSMKAPWAAVKKCATERIREWGYDPEQLARYPVPRSDPSRWVQSWDYPDQPLFLGQGAMVRARLDVDASGAVVGCHPMFQTKPEEFASAACAALTRNASFRPAQDASGRNVKGFWIVRTLWVVP